MKVFAHGYPAWKKLAGKAKGKAAKVAIKAGGEEGSINLATFQRIIKEKPNSILLVDVRDRDEFKKGSFPTAVNLPTDLLEKKLKTWKVNKPLAIVSA